MNIFVRVIICKKYSWISVLPNEITQQATRTPQNSPLDQGLVHWKTTWFRFIFSLKNPAGNYMFKVNNGNTRTMTSLASFWCLYCQLSAYFTPCSSASIVNFEIPAGKSFNKTFTTTIICTTSLNTYIYLFKINNRSTRKKVWNMFRVNNKSTRMTSSTSFWCFYS